MYFPIEWHKVLNLDLQSGNILSIQANHERELFFILTTNSIHVWYPRPAVEIVCHRRSEESLKNLGCNLSAVWKTDSSVIVVATEKDQLLFYQIRRRFSSPSASTFLLPNLNDQDNIYRLKSKLDGGKNFSKQLEQEISNLSSRASEVPALTIFSFGKLDLSTIGVSCLLSAEEELIVAARNGDIYGVFWNGNVDDKFPWSLSGDVVKGSDYVIDIKFSSVLAGFSMVFYSGKVGFMPLTNKDEQSVSETEPSTPSRDARLNYFPNIQDALCVEINHRYKLVAIGLKNSKITVCNIDDINSTLVKNHELEIQIDRYPHDMTKLGGVACMRYSPDSSVLVASWLGGDFAIWSVFGSLLFCSQQWNLESPINHARATARLSCLSWGREGYNLWLCMRVDPSEFNQSTFNFDSLSITSDKDDSMTKNSSCNSLVATEAQAEEVLIISLARSNLTSSPHLTCSSDAIVLISEDKLHVGPSIPHEAKFDHWFIIDLPQKYLNDNFPIRYASVDRECQNLAIAGSRGFALYSIESSKWKFFSKQSHEDSFSVCGDIIWWNCNYLILSCYNFTNDSFELRAYSLSRDGKLNNDCAVTHPTPMEIIKMSIFENRILVLYSDGTLSMFMLNLRRRPNFNKKVQPTQSNAIKDTDDIDTQPKNSRSSSIISLKSVTNRIKKEISIDENQFQIQISAIENLVISNLQANSYCISSIALTRLHFKNNRLDDSILINACGRLFLLEREVMPTSTSTSSPTSDLSNSIDFKIPTDGATRAIPIKRNSNSIHFVSASLREKYTPTSNNINNNGNVQQNCSGDNAGEKSSDLCSNKNVTFKAVSVIATNVEQFWISPEISEASEMSYFKNSLWLYCGGLNNDLQVWLPLLNDKLDPPNNLYVPDRIMLPIKCDIYPLAIRSSAPDIVKPDDAIVLGAESDILYRDNSALFTHFPYSTVKRQCRVFLHKILRELLLAQHLGYYAKKIAESCQTLPYFAHCFELLLHEVLEEEATSPKPLPDPMLPQIVRFIKDFPVYLETVVHCARKSELSMWSHLFDERAVGNPRRLFQECLDQHKLDTAASCLIILQSLDRNIVSLRMIKELIKAAREDPKFGYLIEDLESFLSRAELDCTSPTNSTSPT